MLALVTFLAFAATGNLLVNPDFEKGLDGWNVENPGGVSEGVTIDGRTVARLTVADSTPVGWPKFSQQFPVKPGQLAEARFSAMGRGVHDGFGVYAAVAFLDAQGNRICFEQSSAASGEGKWSALAIHAYAPPGAAAVRLELLLNGHGEAHFDDAVLRLTDQPPIYPPDGPVTLKVTGETACASLIGFGAEDDGWAYADANVQHGVTEEDWKLREARIEWMNPSWVRMFCWYKDWNPSGDWETFDFDASNMKSHYRTLDLYQRLGTRINLTGVEWGVKDPYADPQRVARAIGALFEHIIRTKGYTCVQDWTLSNEPNGYFRGAGYDFNRFAEIHRAVKDEFARRGLKINIVGSDDTDGWPLFEQCVKEDRYFETADLFASHRYINFASRQLLPFFIDDRMKLIASRTPVKPFVVAEFGFQDGRSGTFENPLMEEYRSAIWTAAFAIDCLNRGVAGMCIWCLHETYYPGKGFMNYALWNFKDRDWKPRPVYHAWSMFTRFAKAGNRSARCESNYPNCVSGAVVNGTLFWVNQSEIPVEIRFDGFNAKEVRIMAEATLVGDRDCGEVKAPENNAFQAPPMSFGYAKQ